MEHLDWPTAEEKGIFTNDLVNKTIASIVDKIETGRILILVKRISQGGEYILSSFLIFRCPFQINSRFLLG